MSTDHVRIVKKPTKVVPSKIVINRGRKIFVKHLYQEDVLYDSTGEPFSGPPHSKLTITNKLNTLMYSSRTVAILSRQDGSVIFEKSSDKIVRTIGQSNYDTILSALCSIINQDLKYRSIMALLYQPDTKTVDTSSQTEASGTVMGFSSAEEKSCQTEDSCMDLIFKMKTERRARNRRSTLTPYVIKAKKVIVDPGMRSSSMVAQKYPAKKTKQDLLTKEMTVAETTDNTALKELGSLSILNCNEDSNLSNLSLPSVDSDILIKSEQTILSTVRQHTVGTGRIGQNTDGTISRGENTDETTSIGQYITGTTSLGQNTTEPSTLEHYIARTAPIEGNPWTTIKLLDGTLVEVPVKPEDKWHYASPEILRSLDPVVRKKLLMYQAYVDWKYCLEKDEDGNLPIHNAVLSDDLELLKRQCFMLRNRHESLDIFADNLRQTPLQMSLYLPGARGAAALLRYGADPLAPAEEDRCCLHLAADGCADHLRVLVDHCRRRARDVFENHDDLWKPEYEAKSDEELGVILLDEICRMPDRQGYTPLMLASKMGNYANVKILLEAAPNTVNMRMPNSGDTALYIAVGQAHSEAITRRNHSVVPEHFERTITFLVEAGANLELENHVGFSVNSLLQDLNNPALSMLIGNTMVGVRFFDGALPSNSNFDAMMVLKDKDGNMNISAVNKEKKVKKKNTPQAQKRVVVGLAAKTKNMSPKGNKTPVITQGSTESTEETPVNMGNVDKSTEDINERSVVLPKMQQSPKDTTEKPVIFQNIQQNEEGSKEIQNLHDNTKKTPAAKSTKVTKETPAISKNLQKCKKYAKKKLVIVQKLQPCPDNTKNTHKLTKVSNEMSFIAKYTPPCTIEPKAKLVFVQKLEPFLDNAKQTSAILEKSTNVTKETPVISQNMQKCKSDATEKPVILQNLQQLPDNTKVTKETSVITQDMQKCKSDGTEKPVILQNIQLLPDKTKVTKETPVITQDMQKCKSDGPEKPVILQNIQLLPDKTKVTKETPVITQDMQKCKSDGPEKPVILQNIPVTCFSQPSDVKLHQITGESSGFVLTNVSKVGNIQHLKLINVQDFKEVVNNAPTERQNGESPKLKMVRKRKMPKDTGQTTSKKK